MDCITSDKLLFIEWLSSVTERINQNIEFKLNGKPEPLVFHITQNLFDCLHQRMSDDSLGNTNKRRLPNKTCIFMRKDSVPFGKFTMYAWNIYSLTLLTKIFDTPQIQLQLIKYYKINADGTYTEINEQSNSIQLLNEDVSLIINTIMGQKIAPGKLITYLKVGKSIENPNADKIPFVIEWIPNILPISKVGELRIRFQYGHKSNV